MPTRKTHIITGSGVGAVVAAALHIPVMPLIVGAAIGSGIPDIDSEKSAINQKILILKNRATLKITYIIMGLTAIINGQISLKLIGVFLILAAISGHRKFTHSILGGVSFSGICIYTLYSYNANSLISYMVLGLIIGYVVHLTADSFSNHGLELFWPIHDKNFGLRLISTGRVSEYIFLGASLMIISMIFNYFLYTKGGILIWFK